MELTLLGTAGLAAFLIGGAGVLIIASFRRTIELRGALIEALRRIERLEAQLALEPEARVPPPRPPVQPQTDAPQRTPQPGAAPVVAVREAIAPAAIAEAQPAPNTAPKPHQAAPVARAPGPDSDGFAPPSANVAMFATGLAAFAALAAAQLHALSGGAGVFFAMVIGAIALGLAEWRRQADLADERHTIRLLPNSAARIALFAIALVAVALLYGRGALNAPSPLAAFAVMALTAFGALLLSQRQGGWLIGAALICAAIAPSLAPPGIVPQVFKALFVTLFLAVTAIIARSRRTPVVMWLGSALTLGWIATGVFNPEPPLAWAGACAGCVAIGLAYAWDEAGRAQSVMRAWITQTVPELMIAGQGLAIASNILFLALLVPHAQDVAPAGAALLASAAISVGAMMARPALWPAAAASAALAALALGFWPKAADGSLHVADLISVAAALGFLFSIAGGVNALREEGDAQAAALAALAPVGVLAALHERLGGFGDVQIWALAALTIAAVNALAYAQCANTKPTLASAFAAGAALALVAALYVATPSIHGGLALAFALLPLAAAERVRAERGLRSAALIVAPLAALRLLAPQLYIPTASPAAIIAVEFAASIVAALAAARLFENGPAGAKSFAAQACLALALVLTAAAGTLIARHVFTAGAIGARFDNLAELGVHALIWLGLAALLAWRIKVRGRPILFALEILAAGGAATLALVAGLILINPWWGLAPAAAPAWHGLSAVLLAYGAPALLALVYASLRRGQGMETRSGTALVIGVTLLFAAATLEVRRSYHGARMAEAPILPAEAWAYTAVALGVAALMLALSADRGGRLLRYASLGLALAALAKAILFDLGDLEGIVRLGAFIALVGAGGGLIWFYRRFVLPGASAQAKTSHAKRFGDPNLLPPG